MSQEQDAKKEVGLWGRRTFVLSAMMMVLLVTAAAFIGVTTLLERDNTSGTPSGASAPAPEEGDASGSTESVCGIPAGSQKVPTTMPESTKVSLQSGVVVRTSPQAGPQVLSGAAPSCFAHSPSGAVMAAATFIQVFSSQHDLPLVAQEMLASGQERDRMVAAIRAEWDGSTNDPFKVLGFMVEVRSPDEVLVTVAVGLPDDTSRMTSWPLQMVWDEGDWKVKAPGNTSWGEEQIRNLRGFTRWQD